MDVVVFMKCLSGILGYFYGKRFERKTWKETFGLARKCRINASERLLKIAKFVEFLNVYYSIFVITLSLLSLIQHNDQFSLRISAFSIALDHIYRLTLTQRA